MSRITESLYRITGVELDESNTRANISLVQNLFDEAINKGLFKEAKKIVEDRNIIVDSDGLKVTPTSACTGAYIDLKKLVFNESLTEARNPENKAKLNESKEGLTDYFYSLVNSLGMYYRQQVDNLLYYINESDLLDLIDDIKEQ